MSELNGAILDASGLWPLLILLLFVSWFIARSPRKSRDAQNYAHAGPHRFAILSALTPVFGALLMGALAWDYPVGVLLLWAITLGVPFYVLWKRGRIHASRAFLTAAWCNVVALVAAFTAGVDRWTWP